jgi:integrase/recombinase XerC
MEPAIAFVAKPPLEYRGAFLDHFRVLHKSEHTVNSYASDLEHLVAFTSHGNLTYQDAQRYVAHLSQQGLSPISIRRNISACRSFYSYLTRQGVVSHNPFTDVDLPKAASKLPDVPATEIIASCLEAIADTSPLDLRDKALISLLFGSGARISEAISLRLEDLNLRVREIKVMGKGQKERLLILTQAATRLLQRYLDEGRPRLVTMPSDVLFLGERGTDLSVRGARFIVSKRFDHVAASVHPHALRHAYATALLDRGGDLKDVSSLLGHSSLHVTGRYVHVSMGRLHRVVDQAFQDETDHEERT